MERFVLGLDLGGTKINAAVFDQAGHLISRAREKTEAELGAEAVLDRIVQTGTKALQDAGVSPGQLYAVGIGSPGPLDWQSGVVIQSAHLNFDYFPLGPRLAQSFGCPVFVDNDVNAGTYGEFKKGAAQGAEYALGMFVGTGIGGGIVIHGRLHHGYSKNAGEVGHMVVLAGGPRCNCGARGCLESLASRTAIVRDLRSAVKDGRKTSLTKHHGKRLEEVSSGALKQAYQQEDKLVQKTIKRAAKYIGIGIGSLVNVLGPEVVVLGGGVIEALGDEMLPIIERSAARVAFEYALKGVRIVRAELGDDAGVIGAAIIASERFDSQDRRQQQPEAASEAGR
jgi:glucokinase